MKAALHLIIIALPSLRARTDAEDAERHVRRKVASSHSSTPWVLGRHASPDIVRRLRTDATWPAGPGTHLRSQLVHHAKVPYRVATGSQEPG